MEAGVKKRDTGRARRGYTGPDPQVGPDQPNRKRRRINKDEDATKHTRMSLRIRENLNKRRPNGKSQINSQPSRKSPRLQEIHKLNRQRITRSGKETRSSPRTTGQEQPQAELRTLRAPRKSKQRRVLENKDEGHPESSQTNLGAQRSGKQRRSIKDGDLSNHEAKRPKHSYLTPHLRSRPRQSKEDFIENWLNESCRSRITSIDHRSLPQEVSDNMPRTPTEVFPLPHDSRDSTALISSSKKSEKSAATVHDTDYRKSLSHRLIHINRHDPPAELKRGAEKIISRPRGSPEMNDSTAQELRNISRKIEDEAEGVVVQQLAPRIIPAMAILPDQKLASNTDQLWLDSVPMPLDPNVLTDPLPLPRPKPDLVFGYSGAAFTPKQLTTIDLLIDQFGRSYAVPDKKLHFPFLNVEFKSQAKSGTHYIAKNQVAGAGAIALNGYIELIKRSFGAANLDPNEPQFFSLTMDHESAQINVHWLSQDVQDSPFNFHVEGLSKQFLDDPVGIRAIVRAVKNILDYGTDERLRKLCEALDAYRERVIFEREAISTQENQRHKARAQPEQRRRSKRDQQTSYERLQNQSTGDQQPLDGQQEYPSSVAQEFEGPVVQQPLRSARISEPRSTRAIIRTARN